MIERDPLERRRVVQGLQMRRQSQLLALRENAKQRARLEQELEELDDAITGVDHLDMAALREWAKRLELSDRQEQAMVDEELEQTFPASDPPAHTAPGSGTR